VLVVQQNAFNRSNLQTVICVLLTSNLALANAPGNLFLPKSITGLPKDSVANASQLITIDKHFLEEFVTKVPHEYVEHVLDGVQFVLGR
jgi:mRNA interferase MazF